MVETLLAATAFTAGLACGLRLRYRQRAVLDALLVEATDSVNGTIEAIDTLDIDAVIELSLETVWNRSHQLRGVPTNAPDTVINATPHKIADLCRLTAAETMKRSFGAVSLGAELGPVGDT